MIKRCRVCNGRVKYNPQTNSYICSTCGQEYVNNDPAIEVKVKEKKVKEKKEKVKVEKEKSEIKVKQKPTKIKKEKVKENKENKKDEVKETNEVIENTKNYNKAGKTVLTWIITIALCLGAAKLFTTYVVSSVEVDGYSMYPTLDDGNKALTDALFFKMSGVKRFDIVIIKKKSGALKGEKLVKRVIGLPGERIKYENSKLYVNDKLVNENFIDDEIKAKTEPIDIKLGNDEYYVLGDNREFSYDSSEFGPIKKNEIIGRGLLQFMECSKKDSKNQCIRRRFTWFKSVR